jgi:hypothetical protein
VIHARVAFRPGAPEIDRTNPIFAAVADRPGIGIDDPGTAVHPAVGPEPGDLEVIKKRVSAFAGSDLDTLLRGLGVRSLVLGGIATSGVVLSTVRQAADADFRLTVVGDGCADADDEVQRVLLEKVSPRQAAVVTADEWTAARYRPPEITQVRGLLTGGAVAHHVIVAVAWSVGLAVVAYLWATRLYDRPAGRRRPPGARSCASRWRRRSQRGVSGQVLSDRHGRLDDGIIDERRQT